MWKALLILACAAAVAGLSVAAAVCVNANRPWSAAPADCIVALGAHVWMDGRMSNALTHRCEAALEAWQAGIAPVIIVCGGQGDNEPMPEADAMEAWLLERGVPRDAVLSDNTSVNTRANMAHAKAIMNERGMETAAICTSDYHMCRALWIARDAGIRTTGGIASPSPTDAKSWLVSRFRESCSWVLYFIRKL